MSDVAESVVAVSSPVPWFQRIDEFADRCSDRINPVVVREIRQEFRGVRFGVTLMLSLAFAWLASVFGVMAMYDQVRQPEIGGSMFGLIFAVLSFPLCVVIPFGLLRSMTSEFVGSTWELLVVTPMGASKIVRGKVASAMLQGAIFMALLAPFLCFTWLLKGIGVVQIVTGLVLLAIMSFSLCHLALFCGSLVRKAAWQGFGMIVLMIGSLFAWGVLIGVVPNVEELGAEVWIGGGICFGIGLLYMIVVASATAVASLTPIYPMYQTPQVPQKPELRAASRAAARAFGSDEEPERDDEDLAGQREEDR